LVAWAFVLWRTLSRAAANFSSPSILQTYAPGAGLSAEADSSTLKRAPQTLR
jgi:hypothetical protein